MSWFYLALAALAEILFDLTMKLSEGFTRIGYSVCSIAVMSAGVFLLAIAVKKIPVATAYAIWTGLGVVGTVPAYTKSGPSFTTSIRSWLSTAPFATAISSRSALQPDTTLPIGCAL